MRRTALLIGLLVFALGVSALAGPGEYQLLPSKDTSFDSGVAYGGTGGFWHGRGAKKTWREDVSFWAWDQAGTQAFITAHGGRDNIEAASFWARVAPNVESGGVYHEDLSYPVTLGTIHMAAGEDWVEGNAQEVWYDWTDQSVYAWPEGELRATFGYAAVTWKYDEGYQVVDTDLSKKWKRVDGTEVNDFYGLAPVTVNSAKFASTLPLEEHDPVGDPSKPAQIRPFGSVALDLVNANPANPSFFDDLIYTATCRGFRMWVQGADDDSSSGNWNVYFKEAAAIPVYADSVPYMQIKFFDRIGDANYDREVNYLDLGALAGHYRQVGGATWNDGDFNKDGDVNYLDLGLLAGVYRSTDPPIYTPGPPVPEPISLLLLAGLTPLLRRRR